MRAGDLRGDRRPGHQEADAGGLRPGQPRVAAAGLRPHRLRPTRLGRPGLRQDRLRRRPRPRPDAVPRGRVETPGRGNPFRTRQFRRCQGLRPARVHRRNAGRRAGHRRQPRVLPVHPAEVLRRGLRAAGPLRPVDSGAEPLAPGRHREALRPRPEERPRARRDRLAGLPAGRGLPDRPLPRQGDGAERPGAALRQPDVRAGVERELRRPRADHHGRGHRRGRPGRLLRRHRRRAGRHPEPPAAAARPDRDGGAGLLRGPGPADGEGEGALGGPAAGRPGQVDRPRVSTPRGGRAASRSSATSRRTASRRPRPPRRSPR